MRISELTAYIVHVQLSREIKHVLATRKESANLVVRCRLTDGTEGWGEGVPRQYVTGETPEGALIQFSATPLEEQLDKDCQTWEDVIRLCNSFQPMQICEDPRRCYGNALRCAIELSILDAYGQLFGEPVSMVTQHFKPAQSIFASHDQVQYSTIITSGNPLQEQISALKMRLWGFRQCKVKVGIEGTDDAKRLRRIRFWIGRQMDLRLDANEAWRAEELVVKIAPLLRYGISCVEQPIPHEDLEALAEVRRRFSVPLMLDESVTSITDARRAIGLGACDLFNIRLSKCGGFLASLQIGALARESGIGYQLGCHPGESGILSAAGRHWATSVRDIRYIEGSYDRHLLRELLTNEDVSFGYGGLAPALRRPGLGVTVNPHVLARWKTHESTRRFD
jgi:muconate cycloisomerase